MFEIQVPFFIPLWRRVALIVVCMGWGIFEFFTTTALWGMFFCGIGVYAIWQFFFDGWPGTEENKLN